MPDSLELLEAQLMAARDAEDRAYWMFSRTARGKPVPIELTVRVRELETRISNLKWEKDLGIDR